MGKTLAGRIRAAREEAGMNQSELARALKVSPQAVQLWESGGGIRHKRLEQVARVLRVNPEALLFGQEAELTAGQPLHETSTPSQVLRADAAILAIALDWLDFEEGPNRRFAYSSEVRGQRLSDLIAMILADGGTLSPAHSRALIAAAEQRFTQLEHRRSDRTRKPKGGP